MNFLVDQIKEQKILEMEVNFDDFIKEHGISNSSIIHTMVFDKEVREYLKDKYFYSPIITESSESFIAVMIPGHQVDIDTEVSVDIRRGVFANAADLLPTPSFDEIRFNDKGEINLSCKIGTINLHEGLPQIIEIARVAEGEHPSYGKLKITQEHLESMQTNFKSGITGVDLSVNEDHKKNEAFGWFKDIFLSFDKQTLYGQILWNTKGTQALSEKEYRYFSPEFRFNYVHPHTGAEHGPTILGGALTNYPFLKMEALTELNIKQTTKEKIVTVETIILSEHNKVIIELNGKVTETQNKLDVSLERNVELSAKVDSLESDIKKSKAVVINQKLFTEQKINKAQLVALNEGKSAFEVLALAGKMNTKEAGNDDVIEPTIELSAKEKAFAKSMGLTDQEWIDGNK